MGSGRTEIENLARGTDTTALFAPSRPAESPIPGTSGFEELTSDFQTGVVKVPHFWFHAMPDLPELLIQGKEREYMLGHFFSREVRLLH